MDSTDGTASTPEAATTEAASPTEYTVDLRGEDQRQGRRDGRRQVPSFTRLAQVVEDQDWFTTPYIEEIWAATCDQVQVELVGYQARAARGRTRLAGLREQLAAAQRQVARGAEAVAAAATDLTAAELLPRNPQEVGKGGDVVRSRRESMRAQRIRSEQAAQRRRTDAVDELDRRIAETVVAIDEDFARSQGRGRALLDLGATRVASYWGAVTGAHSEGRQLALLSFRIRRPEPAWLWVAEPPSVPAGPST